MIRKQVCFFSLILLCFLVIISTSYATVDIPDAPNPNLLVKEADDALLGPVDAALAKVGPVILNILYYLGISVSFVVIMIYGIQWILVSDSRKRADLKQGLFPLIAGAFLLFCGVRIAVTLLRSLHFI